MKITQIMLAKGFGGAERYFVDLSIALASLGHDVQVICHAGFVQYALLRAATSLKIEKVSVAGWWDIFAHNRIYQLIANHSPEIVHAHLARGAYVAGKSCSKLGIPLIVKTHNYVDLKYYRNVNCFITTTEDQKNYLMQHGVDKQKISVIPNFSSLQPVDQVKQQTRDKTVFISYGRMVEKKGFHLLIEAVKQLVDSGREIELKLGGDGPERKHLEKLVKENQLEKHVIFCGWINNIKTFADAGDVFVLPSLDEPFGISILEMMAMGKPVIATRTRGPLEILNIEIAWLVNAGDKNDLVKALSSAIEDKKAGIQKAENALNVFKEKYSGKVIIPRLLSLYKEQINLCSK